MAVDGKMLEVQDVNRTVFCSGFPMDIQYREVRNFFRFLPGYQFSVLNLKGRTPTVFASFEDNISALRAIDKLQNIIYDEDSSPNFTIRAEMAKSNIKKPNTTTIRKPYGTFGNKHSREENFRSGEKRNRRMYNDRSSYRDPPYAGPPHAAPPHAGPPHAGPPPFMVPPSPYSDPYPNPPLPRDDFFQSNSRSFNEAPFSQPFRKVHESHYKRGPPDSGYRGEPPQSRYRTGPPMPRYDSSPRGFDNSLITTLFIGNLGMFSTEEEVRDLFGHQPGFRRLKVNVKNNRLVAFVNFSDRSSAVRAFETLQGATLRSSDNGGIKIEFAKTNMGGISGRYRGNRGNRSNHGNHDNSKDIPINNNHDNQSQNSNKKLEEYEKHEGLQPVNDSSLSSNLIYGGNDSHTTQPSVDYQIKME